MRPGTAARSFPACALAVLLALAAPAAAAPSPRAPRPPSARPDDGAEALVREGRRLVAEGRLDEACPRLAAAQKLEPTPATGLALGECLQKAGKTAGARAAFDEARSLAKRAADEAEQRMKELDDHQPKVILDAPGGVVPGTAIRLDGVPIDPSAAGTPIPIEPGTHLLEVSRGESRWSTRVQVDASGTVHVTLPWYATVGTPTEGGPKPPTAPEPANEVAAGAPRAVAPPEPDATPAATAPEPPPARPPIRWEAHRISGVVIGGGGLVAMVVGSVFGGVAISKKSASNDGHCNAADYCDATGRALRADAIRAGNLATATLFAGAAGVASGAAIFFTAPSTASRPARAARIGLTLSAGDVRLMGRW